MHIISSRINHKPHYLDQIILLSPAGYHEKYPTIAKILIPIAEWFLFRFIVAWRFPTDFVRVLSSKLVQDIKNSPATQFLFAFIVSYIVGKQHENPFTKISNYSYHTLGGTPTAVIRHLIQLIRTRRFQAYDYGKKRNLLEYGSEIPLNFFAHYHLIDIPVYFLMGLKDRVIHPDNILKHYHTLQKVHPELAHLQTFDCNHIDFTINVHDDIISYVLGQLKTPPKVHQLN